MRAAYVCHLMDDGRNEVAVVSQDIEVRRVELHLAACGIDETTLSDSASGARRSEDVERSITARAA